MEINIIREACLTCLLTIISGTIVYIASKSIEEYVAIPIRTYFEIRQRVKFNLLFYANMYSNPLQLANPNSDQIIEKYNEASDEIRKCASDLSSIIVRLPKCRCKIPSNKELEECVGELIGISNSFYMPYNQNDNEIANENRKSKEKIEKILKI